MSYVFKSEFLFFVAVVFSSSVCVGQLSGPTRSQLDSYLEKGEFAAANRLAQTAERQKERDSILARAEEELPLLQLRVNLGGAIEALHLLDPASANHEMYVSHDSRF